MPNPLPNTHPPTLQHLYLPFPKRGRGPLQPRPELVDQTRLDLHALDWGFVWVWWFVCIVEGWWGKGWLVPFVGP